MVDIRHFRVFIASSSDTQPERDRMHGVITRLNRILTVSNTVNLDLWRFEEDALPGLSDKGPQALIDPELDKADFVILIVWNRLGDGTAKEYAGYQDRHSRGVPKRDRRRPTAVAGSHARVGVPISIGPPALCHGGAAPWRRVRTRVSTCGPEVVVPGCFWPTRCFTA